MAHTIKDQALAVFRRPPERLNCAQAVLHAYREVSGRPLASASFCFRPPQMASRPFTTVSGATCTSASSVKQQGLRVGFARVPGGGLAPQRNRVAVARQEHQGLRRGLPLSVRVAGPRGYRS